MRLFLRSAVTLVLSFLLAACSGGGQSGTGAFSLVDGNVDTTGSLAGIRVSIVGTSVDDTTAADGAFAIETDVEGETRVRFERNDLQAETEVVIPAGGVLRLRNVRLEPGNPVAVPDAREVELDGVIESIDCQGFILVTSRAAASGTVFAIEVASATFSRSGAPIDCTDLDDDDAVAIDATTVDGTTLLDATVSATGDDDDDDFGEDDDDFGEDDDDFGEDDDDFGEDDDDFGEDDDDSIGDDDDSIGDDDDSIGDDDDSIGDDDDSIGDDDDSIGDDDDSIGGDDDSIGDDDDSIGDDDDSIGGDD